jgi:uncharacterized protein YeaO (DUF488 family)
MIKLKRIYDQPAANDGLRFLVDRVWPRGLSKERLALDGWLRDVAPTDELRRWFSHEDARWDEFRRRYIVELNANPQAHALLQEAVRAQSAGKDLTLLYAARDREHNQAVVLKDYLEKWLNK